MKRRIFGGLGALLLAACLTGDTPRAGKKTETKGNLLSGQFRDVTRLAGIAFTYDNDASPAHRFIETTGGGCAFVDVDGDGLLDIVAVQGGPAPGSSRPRSRPPLALYHNRGDGTFENFTVQAGLDRDFGYLQGVAVGDYDNDGKPDLLLTGYGSLHLLHNLGGRFEDVTVPAHLIEKGEAHWNTSAAWFDYDGDGRLDLFVCRYTSWFPDIERSCFDERGRAMYCAPTQYAPDTCALYHNNSDGTFTDVTAQSGVGRLQSKALGVVTMDYDGDGRLDLFVTNDMEPNWLLHNRGDGTFVNRGYEAGVASGPLGQPLSGMGVAAADFTGSLREDLIVVNFSHQPRSYFLNQGRGLFERAQGGADLGDSNQPFLAFGVESLDYDLDGWPDLVMGNGHINDLLAEPQNGVEYWQRQQLLHNQRGGRFEDDLQNAGGLARPRITRGLAVGDYDNDGRPDVLVSGPGSPLSLFRNECGEGRHWIGFRLEGTHSNRDGIGAQLRARVGNRTQMREVHGSSSYCSHSDIRPLFGLDQARSVDALEVRWPSGYRQSFYNLPADRYYLLREGESYQPSSRATKRNREQP